MEIRGGVTTMSKRDSIYGFGAVVIYDNYDPTGRFDTVIVKARTLKGARIKARKILMKRHFQVLEIWEEQIIPISI